MKIFDAFSLKLGNIAKIGFIFCITGFFFLPSSLLLAGIFLIPSAIIGTFCNKKNYFKDFYNLPFFICGILILINSLMQKFLISNPFENDWDVNLTIAGIGNWLPFFWFFWSFNNYVNSKLKRKLIAKTLIFGTFPVLISGFGQYFFNWTGPFEIFDGLIIWYQKPIEYPAGLSGLFSNQNYAGSWLNLVWPFCIALALEKTRTLLKKTFSISFLISIGFAIFLTNSRNAWSGLLISLPLVVGYDSLFWLLPVIVVLFITIFYTISELLTGEIQDLFREIIPERMWMEFSQEGFENIDASRFEIMKSAIKISFLRPIIGIGAASFTAIYALETNFWKGHSHNLILELAISYGYPVTIIFVSTIILILYSSGRTIFLNKTISKEENFFDRAWWSALFFFSISQLADIQYFDGKISLVAWLLLSGLKNIINEKIDNKIIIKK